MLTNYVQLGALLQASGTYHNAVISTVNDHVVRIAHMTGPYPWHLHPDSDEVFIGVSGILLIETREQVFEVGPGCVVTILKNTPHRTLPKEGATVNLTVEAAALETLFLETVE